MSPEKLEKFKRKLAKWYEKGTEPVSWTSHPRFGQVYMWCADSNNPRKPLSKITPDRAAIFIAYESNLRKPVDTHFEVAAKIHTPNVAFSSQNDEPEGQIRVFKFFGIRVRDPIHGHLPCEGLLSVDLLPLRKAKQFEVVGRPSFDKLYFEPLLLRLED